MTDDEIIKAAEKIKRVRDLERRRDSFKSANRIEISWPMRCEDCLEIVAIPVDAADVRRIVNAHFNRKITWESRRKPAAKRVTA